jgi:hypothetical protein
MKGVLFLKAIYDPAPCTLHLLNKDNSSYPRDVYFFSLLKIDLLLFVF